MKNVCENQLKKCIYIDDIEEFERVVKLATDTDVIVEATMEGIDFYFRDPLKADNVDVLAALSRYYGVQITSIHMDDAEYTGIWLVYI